MYSDSMKVPRTHTRRSSLIPPGGPVLARGLPSAQRRPGAARHLEAYSLTPDRPLRAWKGLLRVGYTQKEASKGSIGCQTTSILGAQTRGGGLAGGQGHSGVVLSVLSVSSQTKPGMSFIFSRKTLQASSHRRKASPLQIPTQESRPPLGRSGLVPGGPPGGSQTKPGMSFGFSAKVLTTSSYGMAGHRSRLAGTRRRRLSARV